MGQLFCVLCRECGGACGVGQLFSCIFASSVGGVKSVIGGVARGVEGGGEQNVQAVGVQLFLPCLFVHFFAHFFGAQYKLLLPFLGRWVQKSLLGQRAAVINKVQMKLVVIFFAGSAINLNNVKKISSLSFYPRLVDQQGFLHSSIVHRLVG